ncbi:MAG: hypothetical protein ACOCPW_01540, partial [Marinilabiliaceae bacterium]
IAGQNFVLFLPVRKDGKRMFNRSGQSTHPVITRPGSSVKARRRPGLCMKHWNPDIACTLAMYRLDLTYAGNFTELVN